MKIRLKNSIEKKILRAFAITLVIVIVTCLALTYCNAYVSELQRCRTYGRSAAYMTREILDEVGLSELENPANDRLYRETRARLRSICIAFNLTYLYVYTVDNKEVRHYVQVVAFDEEKEKIVEEERGLGSTSDEPLDLQELAALRGDENATEDVQNTRFGRESSWITPYLDEKGEVVALIGADIGMDVRNASIVRQFVTVLIPTVMMLSLAFAILYIITKRKVIKPLLAISACMEMFDPERENEPILLQSEDEIQRIADSFNKMSVDIRTYIQHIETITAEQENDRAQLEIARRIQYGIVPAVFYRFEGGVDAGGLMRSAKEVGGDFYDFFMLRDGRCCALVGDVSGKGVAGALFMAVTRFLIRERLMQYEDPAAVLNSVNDELCEHNPEGMFVTAFALILDPETGNVQYANAGHTPPALMRLGDAADCSLDSGIA
ncbi:MAG: SpoIIE family protein phosphatase [Lachnospiraceae bacterium]|nr:SpoIIE family protein phosphatase [Lachnospiraceae bacterium]